MLLPPFKENDELYLRLRTADEMTSHAPSEGGLAGVIITRGRDKLRIATPHILYGVEGIGGRNYHMTVSAQMPNHIFRVGAALPLDGVVRILGCITPYDLDTGSTGSFEQARLTLCGAYEGEALERIIAELKEQRILVE